MRAELPHGENRSVIARTGQMISSMVRVGPSSLRRYKKRPNMKITSFSSAVKAILSLSLAWGLSLHLTSAQQVLTWDDVPDLVAAISPPSIPERVYAVTDFGAKADGQTDARPAIMEAIRVANKAGGGKVVLSEGAWFVKGPIHLLSNIELHLAEGARLTFSGDPDDYLPQVLTRWEGTELFNYSPLIYAYQAVNVALTGQGVVDGNTEGGFATWRPQQKAAKARLREMGAQQVPVYQRVFGEGDYLRPSMIQFFGCSRVKIEGLTINDSPFWVVHLVATDQAIVRGITVDSHRLNNDGIDVESSSNVLIEQCRFTTGDDAIVIKSGRDADGWRLGRPSERIVIRNNYMEGHNALAIGSEMSGGVRHVFMEDNQLGEVLGSLYFKSNADRGGVIEHIWIRNIAVAYAKRPLIQFRTNYHGLREGGYPPIFRHITIEHVVAQKVAKLMWINGLAEAPIQHIVVRDVHGLQSRLEGEALQNELHLKPAEGHLTDLTLDNVTLNGQPVTQE